MFNLRRWLLALACASVLGTAACSSDSVVGPDTTELRKNSGLMGSGG